MAEIERQRADAQRLRDQATRDELTAGEEERTAAVLDARKATLARLESETPASDGRAMLARLPGFGGSADAVRSQIVHQEQAVEAIRAGLRAAADADVASAIERRESRRSECEAIATDLARAQAAFELAHSRATR